jgi:nucleotidyltransferase substrate binding protein (TIGR01987 family)
MRLILGNIDIQPLLDASTSFIESLDQVNSDLTRDGAIQRFEYTFELCWKTMKRLLRSKGSNVNHPKDVFREAAAEGLISDVTSWFEYLEARNRTTHIYKRAVAEEVFAVLPRFKTELEKFLTKIGGV